MPGLVHQLRADSRNGLYYWNMVDEKSSNEGESTFRHVCILMVFLGGMGLFMVGLGKSNTWDSPEPSLLKVIAPALLGFGILGVIVSVLSNRKE